MSDSRNSRGRFFFGASTSAHQVEGGNLNDWTEWEKANSERLAEDAKTRHKKSPYEEHLLGRHFTPLKVENYLSGDACDHYHKFREDFDIARSLGHNAHRFSVEWSRIEPEEGSFDERELEHYREVVRALRKRGMEPFVTLWHFTLPVWLAKKGGVAYGDFPELFARYADVVARALGVHGELGEDGVRFWITLNEPEIYISNAYYKGKWPPGKKGALNALLAFHAVIRAHIAAYRALKAAERDAVVGATMDLIDFEAARGLSSRVLKFTADRLWNDWFIWRTRGAMDFIGLNYYFHNRIEHWYDRNMNQWMSDFEWEIYPEGLYKVVRGLRKWNLPIYITENGVADALDRHRERFLREHLRALRRAVDEGADVRGYFYWSLLDNFEWDSGFWPRFGLVEVDYKTQARTVRHSALAYKKIIEEWRSEDAAKG